MVTIEQATRALTRNVQERILRPTKNLPIDIDSTRYYEHDADHARVELRVRVHERPVSESAFTIHVRRTVSDTFSAHVRAPDERGLPHPVPFEVSTASGSPEIAGVASADSIHQRIGGYITMIVRLMAGEVA